MNIGDLIYSLITLILILIFVMSPFLRKILRPAEREPTDGQYPGESSMYESVDSHRVVNRLLEEVGPSPHMDIVEPDGMHLRRPFSEKEKSHPIRRIEKLSPLKKAIIWKEVLDRPISLRE